MRVQDAYIIAGASTVGHLFNEQELDRDMGVLAGIGAGIAVSVTKGVFRSLILAAAEA